MTHKPPGTFHPPTTDQLAADHGRRLHALEQRPQSLPPGPECQVTATNGVPLTTDNSWATGRWWPWRSALRLRYVMVTADSVDADCTVGVWRSDTEVVTVEFSVDAHIRKGVDITWAVGDWLRVTFDGAVEHLVVQLHFDGVGSGGLVISAVAGIPA